MKFAERQKRYFPPAEVYALQGLGHRPFIDSAEAVREALVEFLKRPISESHHPSGSRP